MLTVPDYWTPKQIATFRVQFGTTLGGQLSLKSGVRFKEEPRIREHIHLIDAEIAWCKANPKTQPEDPQIREAFVQGLLQARFLISRAIEKKE
jgi:hypothetical protein